MTEYETISLAIAAVSAFGRQRGRRGGCRRWLWVGIRAMDRANTAWAAQAVEDRKATQAIMVTLERQNTALERQGAALERQGAALERQGAALERQGAALEEVVRRTASPGPAE